MEFQTHTLAALNETRVANQGPRAAPEFHDLGQIAEAPAGLRRVRAVRRLALGIARFAAKYFAGMRPERGLQFREIAPRAELAAVFIHHTEIHLQVGRRCIRADRVDRQLELDGGTHMACDGPRERHIRRTH